MRQGVPSTSREAALRVIAIRGSGRGSARVLHVETVQQAPAPGCGAPAPATSPQATVRISKQSGTTVEHVAGTEEIACEQPDLPDHLRCEGEPISAEAALAKIPRGETVALADGFARGASLVRDCYEGTGCGAWKEQHWGVYVPFWYFGTQGGELRARGWGVTSGFLFDARIKMANGTPRLQLIDTRHRGNDYPALEVPLPTAGPVPATPWIQGGSALAPHRAQWEDPLDCSSGFRCVPRNGPSTPVVFTPFVTESCYSLTARHTVEDKDASGNPRRREVMLVLAGRL